MQAREFIKAISRDRANVIEKLLHLLDDNDIRFCIIGGVAVSAYAEPLVSLDLDLVVASYQLGRFESLLASTFHINRQPRLVEITLPDSDLRVFVHTDSRHADFVARAELRPVLGYTLPIAAVSDVLQSKVWSFQDHARPPLKRQKDLLDIARLVQAQPGLRSQLPAALVGIVQQLGV